MDGSTVSDDDLTLLPKFHLQAIQLTNCPNISNRVCVALNEFCNLKALKISLNPKQPVKVLENSSGESSTTEKKGTGCTEDLLIELAKENIAKRIQELHLTPCHSLSSEVVEALGKVENLTILGMSNPFIPAESLECLSKLKLTVLKIEGYLDTRDILHEIALTWPNLNTLILNNCSFISSKRLGTLNVFGLLEHLSLENCQIDNSAIHFLNEMRALRYLFLKGCGISSKGLLDLKASLHRLEISSNDKISLKALKFFLSSQKELQSFRLEWNSGSHFAKPSLRGIPENFTHIEKKNPNFQVRDRLKFEEEEVVEFTDHDKEAWEKAKSLNKTSPNVRFLDLNGPSYVLNSDLVLISQKYPHLTHLLLTGLDITCAHLDKLLPLSLQALQLSECYNLSNSAAEILNLFPHLVALKLSLHSHDARYQKSNLTEGILAEIAKRGLGQRLEELQIHPAKTLSEAGLEQIGKMTNLRTLSLSDVSPEVVDKIGEHLGRLVHLSSCHLIDCSLSNHIATIIGNLWPHIHTLSFDYCGNEFTHAGIAALTNCRELTTLSLKSCGLDNQALIELCKLETLQHLNLSLNNLNGILPDLKLSFLKSIDLNFTNITDDELIKFIESQSRLKYIYLNGNSLLTDKALAAIGKLRKIRLVTIKKCPKITKKAITKLKKENSKIIINYK